MEVNLLSQVTNPTLRDSIPGGLDYFQYLIPRLITIIFVVGVVIFFFLFVLGSIQWITAGGSAAALTAARNRVFHAVIGLIVLLLVYMIVKFVNTLYGINIGGIGFLSGPAINPTATPTGPPDFGTCACVNGFPDYNLDYCIVGFSPCCQSDDVCVCSSSCALPTQPCLGLGEFCPASAPCCEGLSCDRFNSECVANSPTPTPTNTPVIPPTSTPIPTPTEIPTPTPCVPIFPCGRSADCCPGEFCNPVIGRCMPIPTNPPSPTPTSTPTPTEIPTPTLVPCGGEGDPCFWTGNCCSGLICDLFGGRCIVPPTPIPTVPPTPIPTIPACGILGSPCQDDTDCCSSLVCNFFGQCHSSTNILLNAGLGWNCNNMCTMYGYSRCLSVGTDATASNGRWYTANLGFCVEEPMPFGCNLAVYPVLINCGPDNYPANWTNCYCI